MVPRRYILQEGHLDCLIWLAKRSATTHSQVSVDGMTAAHAAAQEGHLECLRFLIMSAGCSGLARDRSGCTPMHFAAAGGHRSCVHWLSSHGWGTGSERNKTGSTPLHVAAEHGHLEVVKLLMRGGARADLYDKSGRTAYDIAVETGNEACAQFLLQATHKTLNGLLDNIFAHQSSLKKVRFERKAIEKGIRDSNPELHVNYVPGTQSNAVDSRDPRARRQRSRSFAYPSREVQREARALQTRSFSTESLSKYLNANYLPGFEAALPPVQKHSSSKSYTENLVQEPVAIEPLKRTISVSVKSERKPTARVFRSQTWREGRRTVLGDWSSARGHSFRVPGTAQQYEVAGETSPGRPSVSALVSSVKNRLSWREKKPSVEAYDPRDLVPYPGEPPSDDTNIFRRLYRLSKRKLSRTSSFAVQGSSTSRPPLRRQEEITRDSFLVSGNDDFISGATEASPATSHRSFESEQQVIRLGTDMASASLNDSPKSDVHTTGSPAMGAKEIRQENGHQGQVVKYGNRSSVTDFKLENIRLNIKENALIW
ncbi:protein phosphatase 1 regulatory subunit 12A isoform X2 [Nematostella vectensis]|uniref:protein phosphatase 1 regulatory subunit 12A isoform X2 n=1 Tax=Nematostella vectensis TaxID=45351 RepID=UPI0020771B9D|nr:protein phosphatase 1 regulatory subunit 12A isoform X2 [Nematostella vectensis]